MDQGQVFVFGFPDPTNLTMTIKEAIVLPDDSQGQPLHVNFLHGL